MESSAAQIHRVAASGGGATPRQEAVLWSGRRTLLNDDFLQVDAFEEAAGHRSGVLVLIRMVGKQDLPHHGFRQVELSPIDPLQFEERDRRCFREE